MNNYNLSVIDIIFLTILGVGSGTGFFVFCVMFISAAKKVAIWVKRFIDFKKADIRYSRYLTVRGEYCALHDCETCGYFKPDEDCDPLKHIDELRAKRDRLRRMREGQDGR